MDPSEEMNLVEQADRLSLQDVHLLRVFADPLLMGIVLKNVDFFDMQRLRKVSRDIRSCIDTLKPDPHIKSYSIKQYGSDTCMWRKEPHSESTKRYTFDVFIESGSGKKKCIKYQKERPKNRLEWIEERTFYCGNHRIDRGDWDETETVYCGDAVIERVVNDFKVNIQHQKSTMELLSLKCDDYLLLKKALESRDTPLKVKELTMIVRDEYPIFTTLPYLDSVEKIEIRDINKMKRNQRDFNLTKTSMLDEWKKILELEVFGCTVCWTIQDLNVLNFRKIEIWLNSISTEDLIYLKENLINSANLIEFRIYHKKLLFDERLFISMPAYKEDGVYNAEWYFPMSIPERFLYIAVKGMPLVVRSVDRASVPNDFFDRAI